MKTIYKYPATLGYFRLDMPEGAEVLTVQMQGDNAVMWARVDEDRPKTTRLFALVGTGHDLKEVSDASQWGYIGTVQAGWTVWHLFAKFQ